MCYISEYGKSYIGHKKTPENNVHNVFNLRDSLFFFGQRDPGAIAYMSNCMAISKPRTVISGIRIS